MRVCRVCLAKEVHMYNIAEHKLSAVFEQVTGVQITTEDKLPRQLCWECVARLSSANNFIKKVLKTQWILSKKSDHSKFITISDIESLDRGHHRLETTLGTKFINEYDYLITEETIERNELSTVIIEKSENHNYKENTRQLQFGVKEEEEIFIPQMLTSDKDPIKTEQMPLADSEEAQYIYLHGNVGSLHDKDGNIKEEIVINIKQEASDGEESSGNESFNRRSHDEIEDKTREVCEVVQQHNQINTKSIENHFICDICSKTLRRKSNLVRHIQNHEKIFKSPHKSNPSKQIRSKGSKSTYNCPDCSYKSNERSSLKRHINYKHAKVKVFNCLYCSYITFNKTDLNQHIISKHTKNIFYSCPHCSYKTTYKGDLTKHINCKHTKQTSYNCSYCNFQTYYKNYLSKHVKKKHT